MIPCSDAGPLLEGTVASALGQTLPGVEVVVVDDGSTDPATLALLDGLGKVAADAPAGGEPQVARARVLREGKRGPAAARNAGIAAALADAVCVLEPGDRLRPRFLEKARARLDSEPTLAFVSCWTSGSGGTAAIPDRCDLPALLAERPAGPALVRKAVMKEAGGYDEKLPVQGCEEWDLWITLLERGQRGTILAEMLCERRAEEGRPSVEAKPPELWRQLAGKHAESYRRNVRVVLASRDDVLGDLLAENEALEVALARDAQAAAELGLQAARLRARLERHTSRDEAAARIAELEAKLREAEEELKTLRESVSWKVTSPLRGALDRFRGKKGGA